MKAQKKKKDGFFREHSLVLMIVGISLAVIIAGAGIFSLQTFRGDAAALDFNAGTPEDAILRQLKSKLGGAMGTKVFYLWKLQGGNAARLKGHYEVRRGMTALRAGRNLAHGNQTPVSVTFNNVRTMRQLAERVTRNLEITADDFLHACDSVLALRGFTREQHPAAFVPDTYQFYRTASATYVVDRLLDYRNRFWDSRRTAHAEAMGLKPWQVATIASIVEEETAKADERPKVARLYLNRLSRGMKLQADPTVKFAIGDFSIRRISGSMLETPSPYNTYHVNGLPPGPIRVAEKETIDAVLDAPEHNFIYMCAREDFSGYHNFAVDYATHADNARRYQAELNRRNIH